MAEGMQVLSGQLLVRQLSVVVISVKSTCELEYQLQLTIDAGLLARRVWAPLSAETIEIRRMLCGLRRKVLNRASPDRPVLTTTDN